MPRLGRTILADYPRHVVQRGYNRQFFSAEPEWVKVSRNLSLATAQPGHPGLRWTDDHNDCYPWAPNRQYLQVFLEFPGTRR